MVTPGNIKAELQEGIQGIIKNLATIEYAIAIIQGHMPEQEMRIEGVLDSVESAGFELRIIGDTLTIK